MAHVGTPRQPLRSHSANSGVFRPPPNRAASARPAPRGTVKQPLYRRLLFPKEAPDKPVKQIVQGQGSVVALINERLYTFLAFALRAYVQSWYTRISPQDKAFTPHVASVIVNFISPILANVTPANLLPLILLHMPTIFAEHVKLYRLAESHQGTSLAPIGAGDDLGQVYHSLAPLLACSPAEPSVADTSEEPSPPSESKASSVSSTSPPTQQPPQSSYEMSPIYLQQLVTTVMKLHLPAEDFASDPERIIVREIVANLVLGSVLRRISQAWFWWKVGLAILGEPDPVIVKTFEVESPGSQAERRAVAVMSAIWLLVRHLISISWNWLSKSTMASQAATESDKKKQKHPPLPPHLLQPTLELCRDLLQPNQFSTRTSFSLAEGSEVLFHRFIDGWLSDVLLRRVLTPETSLKVIDKLTAVVFPLEGGYPGPTPPDPTAAEAAEMRDNLELRIHQLLPAAARYFLLAPRLEDQHRKIQDMLEPFSDTACNTHLVAMLLESLILTLVPQLEVGGAQA